MTADNQSHRRIQPLDPATTGELFNALFDEVAALDVPAGKLQRGPGKRVDGIEQWEDSPLVAGRADDGTRYIAVETETQEYLYREHTPERIIDFRSWYALVVVDEDGQVTVAGVYGDRDLVREGAVEILHLRQLLTGEAVTFRTATDTFIELRASQRYRDRFLADSRGEA